LTIEGDVVERAKEHAESKNKSVSPESLGASPITDSLVGMFADSGEDYKVMIEKARGDWGPFRAGDHGGFDSFRFITPLGASDFEAFLDYKSDFEEENSYPEVTNPESYEHFLAVLEKHRNGIELPPGRVPYTSFFYLDHHGRIVGKVSYRETLNDVTTVVGGNLGYEVRLSERGKGLGTRMVWEFLTLIRSMGRRERVLITCDEANQASERVILNNGGVYEDTRISPRTGRPIRRFWVSVERTATGSCTHRDRRRTP
jgi:predicted acetyltransferase